MALNALEFPTLRSVEPGLEPQAPSIDADGGAVGGAAGAQTFAKFLDDSINQVNLDQLAANHAVKDLIAGRNKNIHDTMLSLEKADLSLKLMMQVRNKALEAYKEIMRMQV